MLTRRMVMIAMAAVLAAGPAWAAESFARSQLGLITADGRRLSFVVELAATPGQLSQGLMFRRDLAADAGMLFDFGRPRLVAMWMKNTVIPLDMLFLDQGGLVVHIEEFAVPHSLDPRGPAEPVLAVLEVAGGTVRRLRLALGDRVDHPIFARAALRSR